MDNQDLIQDLNRAEKPPVNDKNGTWVAVDRSSLGFDTSGIHPGEPIVGPDGATYYLGASAPNFSEIAQGQNNAVPTPSNIIQMTPIVQPIALVPYASQNQPMLQYDPYSRPEAPKTERQAYKQKPYPALSLVLAIMSLVGLIVLMFSVITASKGSSVVGATGFDALRSIFVFLGIGGINSAYSDGVVAALKGNSLGVIFPILILLMVIIFLVIFFQYLVRLVKGKTPRNFSFLAVINLILAVCAFLIVFLIDQQLAPKATFEQFVSGKSQVGVGIALYIVAILSLLLFMIPFFTNRHAYVRDHSVEDETYIIKE